MRRLLLLGAAVCLAFGAAGCGGQKEQSEADIKDDLVKTFQRGDDPLDDDSAECFADIVIDEVGVEKLRDIDLSDDEPPPEIDDEIAAASVRASDECDLDSAGG